jgi:hypothetical protein
VRTRNVPLSEAEFAEWYVKFIEWVLKYSSTALCGRTRVQAGFFIRSRDEPSVLRLFKASAESQYPDGIKLGLPGPNGGSAAGLAFMLERPGVVYVPYRKTRKAWAYYWSQHLTYEMADHPVEAWTEVEGQSWFESSLSVPVYFYNRKDRATARVAGILAFSTAAPDLFEPPDYLMAECFAHLISLALSLRETTRSDGGNPPITLANPPSAPKKKARNRGK